MQKQEKKWPVDTEAQVKPETSQHIPIVEEDKSSPVENTEMATELATMTELADKHWQTIIRLQADMENVRRRSEQDIAKAHKYSVEKLIIELLPVVDSLEHSIAAGAKNEAVRSLQEGVELTLKMFSDILNKFSVKSVDPTGQAFDPQLHEALSLQEDPQIKSGTVILVAQKGYTLHDRVIRPARVVVAK